MSPGNGAAPDALEKHRGPQNPDSSPAPVSPQRHGSRHRSGLRRVSAVLFPPSGRRTLAVLVVRRCPFCVVGGHVHRGDGGERQAGCGRGVYYVVARPALVGAA